MHNVHRATNHAAAEVRKEAIDYYAPVSSPDVEAVNHPKHYTSHPAKCDCGRTIECIQITEHMNFNLGNAIKYLWRSDKKGAPIEDLKKAVWYIKREIARREHE
jgi:hypothetical protein